MSYREGRDAAIHQVVEGLVDLCGPGPVLEALADSCSHHADHCKPVEVAERWNRDANRIRSLLQTVESV